MLKQVLWPSKLQWNRTHAFRTDGRDVVNAPAEKTGFEEPRLKPHGSELTSKKRASKRRRNRIDFFYILVLTERVITFS